MATLTGDRNGFLAVITQPHESSTPGQEAHPPLPLSEFHDWYEGEHIPLRLNHLKEFLCGVRYKLAASSAQPQRSHVQPEWLALYLLTSPSAFSNPSYTALREKRSEREKGVMKRIETLVRVLGGVVDVLDTQANTDVKAWTGFQPGSPSPWLVTHQRASTSDESAAESLRALILGQGHLRTHLIKILDSGVSHFAVEVNDQSKDPDGLTTSYWVVHEYTTMNDAETFARTNASAVVSWAVWQFYKAYPCVAQGNVQVE